MLRYAIHMTFDQLLGGDMNSTDTGFGSGWANYTIYDEHDNDVDDGNVVFS